MLACNLARLSLESIKGNLLTYLKGAADVVYFCRLSDCHMLLQDIKPKRYVTFCNSSCLIFLPVFVSVAVRLTYKSEMQFVMINMIMYAVRQHYI